MKKLIIETLYSKLFVKYYLQLEAADKTALLKGSFKLWSYRHREC